MPNIKSYKEIKKVLLNQARVEKHRSGRTFERYELASLAELKTAEGIRDYYLEKSNEATERYEAARSTIQLLKEKIRSSKSIQEQERYTDQLMYHESSVVALNDDANEFIEINNTLRELCEIAERLRNRRLYWEVVKLIPERKLVDLVRDNDGFEHLCKLVQNTIEKLRVAERGRHERRESRRQEMDHNLNVHTAHSELVDADRIAQRERRMKEILSEKAQLSKVSSMAESLETEKLINAIDLTKEALEKIDIADDFNNKA